MTTDTAAQTPSRRPRPYGVAALGAAVLAVSGAGAVTVVVASVLSGTVGLLGALAGAGATLLVLATGFAVVDMVSTVMPTFSMVFALLTYTFQVVLLGGLLAVLRTTDDIEQTLSPGWFAGGVIVVAATWTVCLVMHAMRARVPLYDLPGDSPVQARVGASTPRVEGDER